ncbi:MAG: sugar 3,4-ketoisomerase [Minisyncoccota bacterium]
MSRVDACRLVELPVFRDDRGSLSFVERGPQLPFDIQRVYYLYESAPGATRGAHGHRELEQLMIAVAGAVDVELDDGTTRRQFRLSEPHVGLYVAPMMWRNLSGFAPGTVCMVLASRRFDEADYYRNYADFLAAVKGS